MKGVAVTGMGIVSGAGAGVVAHARALERGESAFRPMSLFTLEGLTPAPVGQVDAAHLEPHPSRTIGLALAAAREALAGRTLRGEGVLALGTTTGGILESEERHLRTLKGEPQVDPQLLAHHAIGICADVLASTFGLAGERNTFSTACSSSANAIGYGAMRVASGAPWALVGGVDSLSRITYAGFHALRLLSPSPCQPFDVARRGLSLGEAAAFLILEPEASAKARGARIHGYVKGWGVAADAHHPTAPHPEGRGATEAMRAALGDAQLEPRGVDYVNAHGTATPANDKAETLALNTVFGESMPLVSSTKGIVGHTLGAAGAVEALFSLLALESGFLPATVGLANPDPALRVNHVPSGGVRRAVSAVLSSSFGFGGNNTALVLTREGA